MAEDLDDTITRELWRGSIPIKFSLASSDLSSTKLPDQIYKLCSRLSYLTCCADTAVEYFRLYAIDLRSTVWFEYNSIPLRR